MLPAPGLMRRAPRDASAAIVDRGLGIRLGARGPADGRAGAGVVAWGEDRYDLAVATTMGLTTLSLMHIAAALEVREPRRDDLQPRHDRQPALRVPDRRGDRPRLPRHGLGPLQRIFDTVPLTSSQWGICLHRPIAYIAVIEIGEAPLAT